MAATVKTQTKAQEATKPAPSPASKPSSVKIAAPARSVSAVAPSASSPQARPGAHQTAGNAAVVRAKPPSDVIELKGMDPFVPTTAVADYLAAQGDKGGPIYVKFGNLVAPQELHVVKRSDGYATRKPSFLDFSHAGLGEIGRLEPLLVVTMERSKLTGFASLGAVEKGSPAAIVGQVRKNPALLGWTGLGNMKTPKMDNQLQGGHFRFQLTQMPFDLSFVHGQLDFGLADEIVTFEARAHVEVKGLAGGGDLVLTRDESGTLSGSADIAITISKLSGKAHVAYKDGNVDVQGTARYTSEKLTGEITILVTDPKSSKEAARSQIDPAKILPLGETVGPGKNVAPKNKDDRVVAGWGTLDFAFTDWLTGKVQVVIDGDGYVTVVGEIAPPKVVTLMDARPYSQTFFDFPINLRYGLPYVADIHVGIHISLKGEAQIGPATLSELAIRGTYSTDPEILNDFSITGAFRFNAAADLALGLEAHAGLGILGHDIDVGAGITGKAGIRGYAEAQPTLGYREKADPTAGKKGEFYIQGHMEIAAQPFLGLYGDFHVSLDSPWWSPAPSKTWTWPIDSLEYPIPGQFGIGADVDYVIGSGKYPDITWGKVDFDSSKFTDALTASDDGGGMGKKSGKEKQKPPGKWTQAPTPPRPVQTKPTPPKTAPKAGKGGPKRVGPATGKKSGSAGQKPEEKKQVPKTADTSRRWVEGMKALGALHEHAEKDPEDNEEIHHDLAAIKKRFGFKTLQPILDGDYWDVFADMNSNATVKNAAKKKNAGAKKRAGKKPGTAKAKSNAAPPAKAPPKPTKPKPTKPKPAQPSVLSPKLRKIVGLAPTGVGKGVKPGESIPYKDAKSSGRGKVRDGLTGDHIPSNAAIQRAALLFKLAELKRSNPHVGEGELTGLAAKLAKEESSRIRDEALTIVLPHGFHAKFSATYGGRNNKGRIDQDARNLEGGVLIDFEAQLVAHLQQKTLTTTIVASYANHYENLVRMGTIGKSRPIDLLLQKYLKLVKSSK